MSFEVSIVILTCDSVGVVERLVDALLAQEDAPSYEVLFMDNASADGTVEYLEGLPIAAKRIVNVPKGEFSHSGTRMRAAELATGRVMVFFVDDIVPIGPHFLRDLTAPVLSGEFPAAYGVFQVHPEEHDPSPGAGCRGRRAGRSATSTTARRPSCASCCSRCASPPSTTART
jgi:glycosyltransferase involved in cell wall biosynthesis